MESPFDSIASEYDHWYETPMGRYVDRVQKRAMMKMARPNRGEKALDLGCGTGNLTEVLCRLDLEVAGIDASGAMLAQAWRRLAGCPGVRLVHGFMEDVPFEDGAFDLVTALVSLEFARDAKAALREACRVTRPQGRVVVGFLNAEGPWAAHYRRLTEAGEAPLFAEARFFTARELEAIFPPGRTAMLAALWYRPEAGGRVRPADPLREWLGGLTRARGWSFGVMRWQRSSVT
jgi:ubiquinone/menaquinone biosynthesis C-methylase UbiE